MMNRISSDPALSAPARWPAPRPRRRRRHVVARAPIVDDRADDLYDEGREAIEEGKYDRAVDRFNKLIELKTNRTDAALYWKAYSLVEARTARRGAQHARGPAEAVRRQPLEPRREGARSRSAAGVRPDGLAGVAGRRRAEADGAARDHAERSRAGLPDHREDAGRPELAEGQGPRAVRPQPEPRRHARATSSPTSRRATRTRICSSGRSGISGS